MKKILSICAAMLMAFAVNAAVINIDTSTEHALRLALNSASSGDVIVMAAGTYNESGDYLAFTGKEVTVRAAEGAEVIIKPVCPVRLKEGAKAEFINVKFDCSVVGSYDYVIVAADDTENKRVVLKGCEFYDWTKNKAMIEATSSRRLAAVTIDSCYFHDCMKSVVFIENTNAINLSITNSTFANISTNTESFWAGVIDSRASSGSVLIDHCTFYNVQAMNTDYAAIGKVLTPGAVVSNCIFMLPTSTDGVRAIRDVSAANNCLTYNYQYDNGTGIHSGVTKNNCIIGQDPLFVDAANGDYTLGAGSPALGAGTDGSDLGDPRWYPAPAPVGDVYEIAGSFNSWTAVEMEEISTDLYMVEASVNAYYNTFKVIKNHDWNPGIGYSADKVNTELSDLEITGSGDEYNNFVFQLPFGIYKVKFYWDAANEKVYLNHDFDFEHNTFSVVGDAALDLSWELSTTDNMIYQGDSTYTLVKENVLVAPGNYGFKAVCNHSWDLNYGDPESSDPNHNAILTITAPGTYNITFSCRYGTPLVTAQAVMQTPFVIENGFYLIGKINGVEGWSVIDLTADRKLVVNPENDAELMKLNVELAENDLIKVVKVEDNAITTWYPANADNYWVDIFHAGLTNVFFSEIPNNNENWYCGQLYVNLTPYRRHIEDWATICLPHGGALVNATAYNVTSCLEDHIIVEPIEGDIVKGKPYIIKPIDDTQDIVVNLTDGKTTTPDDSGVLKGNLDYTNPLIVAANANNYVLYDGELHLVVAGEEQSVKVLPYRAYLHIELTGAPSLRIVEAENGATNIENLGKDENAVKFIQNGQLYIKRNNVIYTATGAVVK